MTEPITPSGLAQSVTIMTGFMREPTKTYKTFAELVEIFARRHETLAQEGDDSDDLRVLKFEPLMMAGQWQGSIVFLRDKQGRIAGGIHRGIAYLRCLERGAEPSQLPPLLVEPLGSWRWPPGLKERIEEEQAAGCTGRGPARPPRYP